MADELSHASPRDTIRGILRMLRQRPEQLFFMSVMLLIISPFVFENEDLSGKAVIAGVWMFLIGILVAVIAAVKPGASAAIEAARPIAEANIEQVRATVATWLSSLSPFEFALLLTVSGVMLMVFGAAGTLRGGLDG